MKKYPITRNARYCIRTYIPLTSLFHANISVRVGICVHPTLTYVYVVRTRTRLSFFNYTRIVCRRLGRYNNAEFSFSVFRFQFTDDDRRSDRVPMNVRN